uniref:Homeobox domain-containing protein n=1 Tax=Panagrolaimus sp. ES5 TaxID=591445 RepID=A0AC34GWM2_9BILA
MDATLTTFQGFIQSSFLESSSPNGPTLQQMAALSAYSTAAMIAQQETKLFTQTIYSQMASMVLSHRYPPVYFADMYFPLRDMNNTSTDNIEHTKNFVSFTGFEETSKMPQASSEEKPSSSKISSTNNLKLPTSYLSTFPTQKCNSECTRRLRKEDVSHAKEKAADNSINGSEDNENGYEDDGPPVLERFDAIPLRMMTRGKHLQNKSGTSPDGYKHPKNGIEYCKSVCPQLVPNKYFTPEELANPTQPLEEWFLTNLSNPFPSAKQFTDLQYASSLGHRDIRNWFDSRRKYFRDNNPKCCPWSKTAVTTKRRSLSSVEDNVGGKGSMDEVVAKKVKTIKREVSELEF